MDGVKEFIVYTAARFGLFLAIYGVILGGYVAVAGTPVPVLWPLLLAAVLSTVASTYLLRGMRERLAAKVQERATRVINQIAEQEKFDLIVQEAVFAASRIDITEKVIRALAGQ